MQILGNLFNIIIFVSFIGSLFTIMLLFLQKVLRFTLPLWAFILGMVFYLVPVIVPQVRLVPPEETSWVRGYEIACVVWIVGAAVFLSYYLLRGIFAYRAVKRYSACEDERLLRIYSQCVREVNSTAITMTSATTSTIPPAMILFMPPLLFGTLKDPACVVTIFRPVIILNKEIVLQLSDKELQIVFCHELMHIKRKHHLTGRIYDIISVLYWFNPLMWIAKHEFAYICEMDCDNYALKLLSPKTTIKEYTDTMLHLMELSSETGSHNSGKLSMLSFFIVKQRFINILHQPSRKKNIVLLLVVILCTVVTIMLSVAASRSMFYPYPAYSSGNYEYPAGNIQ